MAKRKMRKFEEGGDVNDDMYSDYGGKPMSTTEYTVKEEVEEKPARKSPVVTKEELAASGLSLRDYLNKQQGLTRRGEPSPQANANYSNEGRARPAPMRQVTQADQAESYVRKQAARKAEDAANAAETENLAKRHPAVGNQTPVNAAKQARFRENLFDSPLTRAFKAIRERDEATAP